MQKNNVYIETYGCQMNLADTEIVLGSLKKQGYDVTNDPKKPMLFYLTLAAFVITQSKEFMADLGILRRLKKINPNLVVGVLGCMAERLRKDLVEEKIVDLVVGPDEYRRLLRIY